MCRRAAGDMSTDTSASGSGPIRGPRRGLADRVLAAVQHSDEEELPTSERTLLLQAAVRPDVVPRRRHRVCLVPHSTNRANGT